MHETKAMLIEVHGWVCAWCGEDVGRAIQRHHIVPKSYFKSRRISVDESYNNSVLLCPLHHGIVHNNIYGSKEYEQLMKMILRNKKPYNR